MGKRTGALLVTTLVLVPMAAQAQKPSGNVWTRSAEVYLESGQKASNSEDKAKFYREALEQAMLASQKDPNNPLAWQLIGRTHVYQGDAMAADSALDKAESLWPAYVKEDAPLREQAWVDAYNAGVKAIQANNMDDAIQKLLLADQIYQGRPAARMTLASLYLNKTDYDNAAKYYEGALEILNGPAAQSLQPAQQKAWQEDKARATERLGQLLMATRKYDEAIAFFQKEVAADPNNPSLKVTLARAYSMAGKDADAKAIFLQLINTPNLTDEQYTDAGVALFRAQDFPDASAAFRKAVAVNPYNHAALYNLSQSLLAQTQPIEAAREKAAPAAQKPFATQLAPFFTELKDITGRFLDMEPANTTALRLAAATARGLADVAPDAKAETAAKNQALAFFERADSLTFDVSDASITQGDDGPKVTGTITNRKLEADAPIKLSVQFLGKDGMTLDTQDVTVPAPAKEQTVDFTAKSTAKDVVGWKYSIAQ